MGFPIKTSVLLLQHGCHRSRQIAMHPLGKPELNLFQIRRHKDTQCPLRQQRKLLLI